MAEDDLAYKVYMTDGVKAIFTALGGKIESRYYDLIRRKTVQETRTAEEIIDHIRKGLRGK